MQRLYVGLDGLLGIKRCAVAATFHEGNARHHRIAMERIKRVGHGLLHQPMDHETMLLRIDLRFAAACNHEMQAVRRDRAVEEMVRRARGAAAWFELRIAQRAHDFLLEF